METEKRNNVHLLYYGGTEILYAVTLIGRRKNFMAVHSNSNESLIANESKLQKKK